MKSTTVHPPITCHPITCRSPHNLPLFSGSEKTSYGDPLWFQEIFWKIRWWEKGCRDSFSFLTKKSSITPVYFLFLPIPPSFFLFSPFCVQKMPEINFSNPKSLENQLEWLQFSEIIGGPHNLPHHPITCRSLHNLPFFFRPEKQVIGWCTVVSHFFAFLVLQ